MLVKGIPAAHNIMVTTGVHHGLGFLKSKWLHEVLQGIPEFEFSRHKDGNKVSGKMVSDAIWDGLQSWEPQVQGVVKKWSRALAWVNPGDETIYLNIAKPIFTEKKVCELISHEFIHIADNMQPLVTIGHGSNSPVNKVKSVPYFVGLMSDMRYPFIGELYKPA